jgi:hypothetical protein
MAQFKKNMEKEMASMPDSIKKRMQFFMNGGGGQQQGQVAQGGGGNQGQGQGSNNGQRRRSSNRLWYIDNDGLLKMSPVQIGLTDGKNTEIVRGRNITEGMKVISGVIDNTTTTSSSSTNVFNPTQNRNSGPGGPGGFRGF